MDHLAVARRQLRDQGAQALDLVVQRRGLAPARLRLRPEGAGGGGTRPRRGRRGRDVAPRVAHGGEVEAAARRELEERRVAEPALKLAFALVREALGAQA